MWETRWWGWDRIGHKASVARWQAENISITAWDWCKKNTVRVTGSGYVIDVDFRTYYASTESIHVNNPCGL
jgi:NAD(P)H-nitrite reductase large subunit